MSQQKYITLSEAVSLLAFNKRFTAERLTKELTQGHYKSNRVATELALQTAANRICNLGLADEIECFGYAVNPKAPTTYSKLQPTDFRNYPWFLYVNDALVRGDLQKPVGHSEYSIAFHLYDEGDYFRDVVVDVASFVRSFGVAMPPPMTSSKIVPFTLAQLRTWMAGQPRGVARSAWNANKADPRFSGFRRPQFEKEWSIVHKTTRGRPKK
jgi:hypothetical protein